MPLVALAFVPAWVLPKQRHCLLCAPMRIDEIYFLRGPDGRLARAWGLEDTLAHVRSSACRGEPARRGERMI